MAAYLASKQRLFAEVMASGGMAVLNRDAPEFAQLAAASTGHGHRLITFGRQSGDLRLAEQQPEAEGQRLVIEAFGRRESLFFPRRRRLPGRQSPGRPRPRHRLRRGGGPGARRGAAPGRRPWPHRARGPASQWRADLCRLFPQARRAGGGADRASSPCPRPARRRLRLRRRSRPRQAPADGRGRHAARRSHHRHRRQSAQRGSGGDPPRGPGRRSRMRSRSATGAPRSAAPWPSSVLRICWSSPARAMRRARPSPAGPIPSTTAPKPAPRRRPCDEHRLDRRRSRRRHRRAPHRARRLAGRGRLHRQPQRQARRALRRTRGPELRRP